MPPKSVDEIVLLILSCDKPDYLKKNTWWLLDEIDSKIRRVVVVGDDDRHIAEYRQTFGDESVYVYSKRETHERCDVDTIICYHGKNESWRSPLWARNDSFRIARELGYRWFMVFDDDYSEMKFRRPVILKGGKMSFPAFKENVMADNDDGVCVFDRCCLKQFAVLDSSPWLYSCAFPQTGDFIGGYESGTYHNGYMWKSMNAFFCDTEKEYRFSGLLNDDVNGYVLNGIVGRLSLTSMHMPAVSQPDTQSVKKGLTETYRHFGTYAKSLSSVVALPSAVYVGCIGNLHPRIHHHIKWKLACPAVVDESACRGEPLDYSECIDRMDVPKADFADASLRLPDGEELSESSLESFF